MHWFWRKLQMDFQQEQLEQLIWPRSAADPTAATAEEQACFEVAAADP